jgi:hypothetical protein
MYARNARTHAPELARVKVLERVDARERAAHDVANIVEAAAEAPQPALHQARDELARVLQLCVWV